MPFTQTTIKGWLSLCAGGLVACSGSAPTTLVSSAGVQESAPDAASDATYAAEVDGAAEIQAAPTAPPGTPLVGRGDNFSPDAGDPSGESDAGSGLGSTPSSTSPPGSPALDAASAVPTCPVTFTVTSAIVDGFVFKNVILGGDAVALGAWDPAKALKMTAAGPAVGTWTITVPLVEGSTVHFEFGMSGAAASSWESSSGGDRVLAVACAGGTALSYTGQFNQVPDGG